MYLLQVLQALANGPVGLSQESKMLFLLGLGHLEGQIVFSSLASAPFIAGRSLIAAVAKLANAPDLESGGKPLNRTLAGANPASRTSIIIDKWAIRQSLSFRALDRRDHAFAVRHVAMIPAKGEFGAIPPKMLLAHLVERAVVAAFEQREE